jgi:hypothetical protein
MKAVNKQVLLDMLEKSVEDHIAVVVSDLQNRSPEFLNRPAADGGWSIAQCLDHLNSYGLYYLPQIEKALSAAGLVGPDQDYKSSWLGSYFIKMMEPETGKKKYKAFKDHIPASELNAVEVVAEFIRQQEKLLHYLRTAARRDLNKTLPISISRLIRLKLGDVFQFIIAHNERHMQQAQRNLARQEEVFTSHD